MSAALELNSDRSVIDKDFGCSWQHPRLNIYGNSKSIAITYHLLIRWKGKENVNSTKMGIEQPFLYDHPTKYSFVGPGDKGFNPRAATQANWTPPLPRSKHDGPLIQSKAFNRHPDSYLIMQV